ncbi:hypothetical protein CDG76_13410 [Nostoc sp. 'Peltigera membranacea cyanobiont' 210A]|uniref:hypothetical protein n=1 Tax=Nostoc sp. 'Peltigera membranacea cyanobiont' 210A TaxID=2014529 RepID=UPI000B953386|nr:hypothetical protein [Nostoc sp. 'Peltigera membranacea cyanobiont' 210A]OYD94419.1 hypothetical protein CDG76_13410 [Nostoc sp. 'Peltigera membranacea cyanobiont' 210A]
MSLQEIIRLAKQLSTVDKVRLIQQIAPDIERELTDKLSTFPRQSLWGLCVDLGNAPSADEIDIARSEEWASFPREDI